MCDAFLSSTTDESATSLKDYVNTGHDFIAIAESMAVAQTDNTNVINENTKKLNDNTTSTFEKTEQDKLDKEQTQKRIEVLNEYNLALSNSNSS